MNLTQEQIKAALDAAGVANAKQAAIITNLLTLQGTPPPDPPLTNDEKRQILRCVQRNGGLATWPAFATRGEQARRELATLFAALDSFDLAEKFLDQECEALRIKLGED